jgi:hypothetical protein
MVDDRGPRHLPYDRRIGRLPVVGLIVIGFVVGRSDVGWGIATCMVGLSMLALSLVAGNGKGSDEQ